MMALQFSDLLLSHPTNPVENIATSGSTNKEWANNYKAFGNMSVHTTVDGDGNFTASFDPWFLPEYEDDIERSKQWGYPPNKRYWRFKSEDDIKDWFLTEIVNVVLLSWTGQPIVLQQSEISPLERRSAEKVDHFYTIRTNAQYPFLIGEFKKNIMDRDQWQSGHLTTVDQLQLSRELRGYCIKYRCPQGYCFDGEILVVWQLRAEREQDMEQNCPIDIWVLPRGSSVTTFRYALNRLFSQALRRCQGELAYPNMQVSGYSPEYRRYFSGEPMFRVQNELQNLNRWGYYRAVDPKYGAFFWKNDANEDFQKVWDTAPAWG